MTSSDPLVLVRVEERPEGHIATVAINNPTRLNALGSELLTAFVDAVRVLGDDPALRLIVVTGAGERAFVGGADIRELAALRTPEQAREFILKIHAACDAVRAISVPVIARIQGYTFGAGLELAAACDIRVAAATAQFGMPEVRLGIPSVVEAALLPLLIGWGRARRLLLTGETIDAHRALAWGLVDETAPADSLDAAVEKFVGQLLACGPEALRRQKALITRWETLPLKEAIAEGVTAFARSFESDEPRRMLKDFLAAQAARKRSS